MCGRLKCFARHSIPLVVRAYFALQSLLNCFHLSKLFFIAIYRFSQWSWGLCWCDCGVKTREFLWQLKLISGFWCCHWHINNDTGDGRCHCWSLSLFLNQSIRLFLSHFSVPLKEEKLVASLYQQHSVWIIYTHSSFQMLKNKTSARERERGSKRPIAIDNMCVCTFVRLCM